MISEVELTIALRSIVAALFGFVVGWQRESIGAAAGDRTFALMALGAAALTAYTSTTFPDEIARVSAGVVTGIGFIGGGMIMRMQTGRIRGLTTAASMWATTSIGVIVGTGYFLVGGILTAAILLILTWERFPLFSRLGVRTPRPHLLHARAEPSEQKSGGPPDESAHA